MKTALKTAMPTVLAFFLVWILIEAAKYARDRYRADQAAKRMRTTQAQAAAAAAAADQTED